MGDVKWAHSFVSSGPPYTGNLVCTKLKSFVSSGPLIQAVYVALDLVLIIFVDVSKCKFIIVGAAGKVFCGSMLDLDLTVKVSLGYELLQMQSKFLVFCICCLVFSA